MQHKEIIGLMKGTAPYTNKTLSNLSKLIEKFPYFQTAHLLHTLNLQHLQDSHFLIDLRKTAVYVPDRKQLFFLTKDSFFIPEKIEALDKETNQFDSSFKVIDSFLSKNDKINNNEQELLSVPSDYISYFISDNEEKEEAPPLQYQETIDKFLEKDAMSLLRIKPDKVDNKGIESADSYSELINDDGFFSETLAKIYIKQKKYSKALEIINKLNLIYPGKNRYFADQIRFLEKLIINTNKNK